MNNGLTPNEIFNHHVRITSYLEAKNTVLSDTERLEILKIANRSASYPYEVQFKIAQLFVKYNTQLTLPNWQYETMAKKVELEWLKACFLHDSNWKIDPTNPFHILILTDLLSSSIIVPQTRITLFLESNIYLLQKHAILFIKRGLEKGHYNFKWAKSRIKSLFNSENDSLILGALEVINHFPFIFDDFPEKEFWIISKKSETIQIAFIDQLKHHPNHELMQRILEGESWSLEIKKVVINNLKHANNAAIIPTLFNLFKRSDERLGSTIVKTLISLNKRGFKLDKKQLNILLETYAKSNYYRGSEIAELIAEIDQEKLNLFTQNQNTSLKRKLNLLVSLNNKKGHEALCKLYPTLKKGSEKTLVLDAFLALSHFDSEDSILSHFDELPGQSMRFLYYLGNNKTADFLKEKLNINAPTFEKINVYDWEEQAVTFLLELSTKPADILNEIARWNPPYFNQITAALHPQVDGSFFEQVAPKLASNSSPSDLKRLMKKLISFEDKRGLSILSKLVLHDNEEVRNRAVKSIGKLLGNLYDNKKISPRTLLKYSIDEAVLKAKTFLLINLLKQEQHNFENQTIILQYLANAADKDLIEQNMEIFLAPNNVHLEKIGIEIIGNTKSNNLSKKLLPFLTLDSDIFRMRQAIIASKKIGSHALTESIVKLLQHRNMNIKKAVVDYLSLHWNYSAIQPLFNILKYNDNSGLRAAVKAALKNMLFDGYLSYALNVLEYCKINREKELMLNAIDSEDYKLINEIGRIHANRGFNIEMNEAQNSIKESGLKLNSEAITSCQNAMQELIANDSDKNKKRLRKSIQLLNKHEFVLITDELRLNIEHHPELAFSLLDILRQRGGIIDPKNLYIAASANDNDIRNWAFPAFLQTENNFDKVQQLKMNKNLAKLTTEYFISTNSKKVINWAINEHDDNLAQHIFNSFKHWEFQEVEQLNTALLSNNTRHVLSWLSHNPLIKSITLPTLFNLCKTQDKVSLIEKLSEEDILSIQHKIIAFYNNLDEREKLDFRLTFKDEKRLFPYFNSAFINDIIEGHLYISYTSLNQLQIEELTSTYLSYIAQSRNHILENQDKIASLFNLLKDNETIFTKTVDKLIETDLFWEDDLDFVSAAIRIKPISFRWQLLAKHIKNGKVELIQLFYKHSPIHKELLHVIYEVNLAGKLSILTWLDKLPEQTLYFPQLFEAMVAMRQDAEITPIVLRLMYKMCNYDQKFVPDTLEYLQTTLLNSDTLLQINILNDLLVNESEKILAIQSAKEFLLSKFEQTEQHTIAISCIIQSINWLNPIDVDFLLQHFKRQQEFDSAIISTTIDALETLTPEQQTPILIELSKIKAFKNETYFAIMLHFGADYQALELLEEADKRNIITYIKSQVLAQNIADEQALRAIIKSMGAYGVPNYDQLLETLLNEHKSSKIRSLALRGLKKTVAKSRYLEICQSLLTHKDIGLLKQAISTLAHSKKAEITPTLVPLLFHKNSRINKLALNGFTILNELALPFLKKEVSKARPDKRKTIEELITRLEQV